ncbi:hypothetical protein EYC80_008360 [Monilinia laxa]|uniref:Zn(2)-C6 fungal-type domain-containing protein n=1 Tax=Monilinia laxa TaxID=61186 RepID=A0A5N6JQ09_MONLA|nr:hypothetical protein EYC80_008360 [Monilinia laxa]
MVTGGYYPEEEPIFHRYGPRGQSYPLAQERSENPHASRSYSDGRSGDHGSENIEPGHPMRRRIQVACQRCRKRKIRCSGEDNGKPCYHCKNSSTEPCIFLRVTAMQLEQAKDLPPDCFEDNSRSMYRVPSNAHFNNYYQASQTVNLGSDSMNYRHANYANYGYQGTRFLGLAYETYAEEPADYNLSSPNTFQVATQDPVSVSSYPTQNNGRTRVNPQAPMYLDSEAATNYGQNANYNQNPYQSYNTRSMVDSESKNFCVTGTASLPSYAGVSASTVPQTALNVTNGERLLPYPSVNRQYRSTNDGTTSSQISLQPYGFMNSSMGSSGKMNGTSIEMPLATSYISVPTSSSQEITTAAAEMAYSSAQLSIGQQDTEIYDTPNHSSSLYYSQTNNSTPDISRYGTSMGSDTPKSRQSSQTNTTENSWAANNRKSSNSGSLLSNGQSYVPSTSSQYPRPSTPVGMQSHSLLQHPLHITQAQNDGLPHLGEYVSSISR